MAAPDFGYFLNRKYALLDRQADTADANSRANITASNAAAGLDTARTRALPRESASQIGLQGAQARLLGEQATIAQPLAQAQIGQLNADAFATRIGGQVAEREGLMTREVATGSLERILGQRLPTIGGTGAFSLGQPAPTFRRSRAQDYDRTGNLTAAGLDYINGF